MNPLDPPTQTSSIYKLWKLLRRFGSEPDKYKLNTFTPPPGVCCSPTTITLQPESLEADIMGLHLIDKHLLSVLCHSVCRQLKFKTKSNVHSHLK